MKTYKQELSGKNYLYYYDISIKLWTVYEIDEYENQISIESDYFNNKSQLKDVYNFDFKNGN